MSVSFSQSDASCQLLYVCCCQLTNAISLQPVSFLSLSASSACQLLKPISFFSLSTASLSAAAFRLFRSISMLPCLPSGYLLFQFMHLPVWKGFLRLAGYSTAVTVIQFQIVNLRLNSNRRSFYSTELYHRERI
jgi:hypothetical protein